MVNKNIHIYLVFFCVPGRVGGKRKPGQGPLPSLKQIISFLRQRRGATAFMLALLHALWPPPTALFLVDTLSLSFSLAPSLADSPYLYLPVFVSFRFLLFVLFLGASLRLFGLHFSRTHFWEFAEHSVLATRLHFKDQY